MPKNHSQIKAKQIKGKKIREQYLDGLLWGLPFGVTLILLISLFDIENFIERVKDVFILVLCFLPVIIFVILNKICIGKIICTLTDDRIYYFNAFTKIKKQNNRTNGYVYYSKYRAKYTGGEYREQIRELRCSPTGTKTKVIKDWYSLW